MQAESRPASPRRSIKPERFLALGFFLLILAGGLVLALPLSSADGRSVGVRQAMFTATSAVCVTGLSIVDVGVELSFFGQVVLLMLIQVGGLGFMAFATLIMVALGRRISLRDRVILRDAMNQSSLTGMVRLTLWFFLIALIIELTGALLLMTRLIPLYGPARGVWQSLFTSVSAFCNAGFDLFGGYRSLTHLTGEPVVVLTLGALIILGGLGFPVILECLSTRFRWRRLSVHARLVLVTTGGLLAFGTLSILALEWSNPATLGGGLNAWQKVYNGFFQSVTCRTAGFASLDQASLTDASKLISGVLMFVGTSSASTGGGVKTTTAALLVLIVMQVARGHERISVFRRELSPDTARRAVTIVLIAQAVILAATCLISMIERGSGHDFLDILFETISAFSTTGLSSVNTPTLTPASHWVLMPLMYFGRVGPLTLACALAGRLENRRANRVHYPEEKIMIG